MRACLQVDQGQSSFLTCAEQRMCQCMNVHWESERPGTINIRAMDQARESIRRQSRSDVLRTERNALVCMPSCTACDDSDDEGPEVRYQP